MDWVNFPPWVFKFCLGWVMCMLNFIWVNCDFVSNFFWKNIILLSILVSQTNLPTGRLRFSKLLFWLELNQVSQISSCLLTQHIPKSITSESFLILNITFSICWKLLLTLNRISVRDRLSCQIQLPLPNHPDPYSHFLEVDFATRFPNTDPNFQKWRNADIRYVTYILLRFWVDYLIVSVNTIWHFQH